MDYAGVPAGLSLADIPIRRSSDLGAFDHLAVGEHSAIVVRYDVKDAQGATVAQTATITITGTNDAPTVSTGLTATRAEVGRAHVWDPVAWASGVDAGARTKLRVVSAR